MKSHSFVVVAAAASILGLTVAFAADENHETIEKVMKEGLKGDESPLAMVLDGKASDEQAKGLNDLVKTLEATKAPVGDQGDYDKKVGELIAAIDAIAGGEKGSDAIDRLDEASNCKACHNDHKPKKEK